MFAWPDTDPDSAVSPSSPCAGCLPVPVSASSLLRPHHGEKLLSVSALRRHCLAGCSQTSLCLSISSEAPPQLTCSVLHDPDPLRADVFLPVPHETAAHPASQPARSVTPQGPSSGDSISLLVRAFNPQTSAYSNQIPATCRLRSHKRCSIPTSLQCTAHFQGTCICSQLPSQAPVHTRRANNQHKHTALVRDVLGPRPGISRLHRRPGPACPVPRRAHPFAVEFPRQSLSVVPGAGDGVRG